MEYRLLGSSGCAVSALALGTLTFGNETDQAASFSQLDRFTEAGGTLVDSADVYADLHRLRPPSHTPAMIVMEASIANRCADRLKPPPRSDQFSVSSTPRRPAQFVRPSRAHRTADSGAEAARGGTQIIRF